MDDVYGPLLFEEDLSAEQREALQKRLEGDSELAAGWARWKRVRAQLRQRLREQLPDRRLLVLYALEQDGKEGALTPQETEALDAARDDITEAVNAIPALSRIVERIQEERADFEAMWAQHQDDVVGAPAAEHRSPAEQEREERAPRRSARSREKSVGRRWAWRLTVAALLLGAAVLAVFYGPREASRTTVTVSADDQRVVEFGDGSTARLVGAAALSFDPELAAAETRRVTLTRGQAYFDIVSRDGASFVVTTPTARAEVLGTQFGVTTGNDTTEVVLVEGKVRVGTGSDEDAASVVLKPGERSMVRRGNSPSTPTAADLTTTLGWTGLFMFRSTPTATIAERMSEHYDVSITVAPALADKLVTGDFARDQSVEQVLGTIARTLGAEVRAENGNYRLVPSSE